MARLHIALLLVVALSAPLRAQSPTPAAAAPSVVVTIAVDAWPESFDPALDQPGPPTLIGALNEPLVRFKPDTQDFDPNTSLAAKVQAGADGLVWEVVLKSGTTFSDGTPLDAEAVAWSLSRLFKADHPAKPARPALPESARGVVKNVVVRDKTNLAIELNTPYSPMLNILASPHSGIISPASWSSSTGKLANPPVGCGAFSVTKQGPGKQLELTPNAKHCRAKPGMPRIIAVSAPSGPARVLWLMSARGDVVEGLTNRDAEDLSAYPKFKILKNPGLGMVTLYINGALAPFQQPLFREAVIRGIPDELLARFLYDGRAMTFRGFYPPWSSGSRGLFKPYAYDPVEAKRLLQMANFDRNGTVFVLWLVPPDDAKKDAMPPFLESLRASMRELGISCLTEIVPRADFEKRVTAQPPHVVLYWHDAVLADADEVATPCLSKERPLAKLCGIASQDDVQTLVSQARTRDSQQARDFLYSEIEAKLVQMLSVISLACPSRTIATSDRIAPLKPGMDGMVSLEDLKFGP